MKAIRCDKCRKFEDYGEHIPACFLTKNTVKVSYYGAIDLCNKCGKELKILVEKWAMEGK